MGVTFRTGERVAELDMRKRAQKLSWEEEERLRPGGTGGACSCWIQYIEAWKLA